MDSLRQFPIKKKCRADTWPKKILQGFWNVFRKYIKTILWVVWTNQGFPQELSAPPVSSLWLEQEPMGVAELLCEAVPGRHLCPGEDWAAWRGLAVNCSIPTWLMVGFSVAGLQWVANAACILPGVLATSEHKGMPGEMITFYLIKIPMRKMWMFSTCHLVPALTHLSALSLSF